MKKNRFRFFNIKFPRRMLLLLGCLFFSWSVLVPFYQYMPATMIERYTHVTIIGNHYSILYWSFRAEIYTYGFSPLEGATQKWFFDYWFGDSYLNPFGLSWTLLAIFVSQIATLLIGMVSVFSAKKTIAVVPVATCLTTAFLMIHTNILSSKSNVSPYYYQLGYWLTYLSLCLFIGNFLLTLISSTSKMR